MEKLLRLKTSEMKGSNKLVVELELLDKELLREIMTKNDVTAFYVPRVGLGLNLSDILNGKDLVRIIEKDQLEKVQTAISAFEDEYLGNGDELDFESLTLDEKLNTIYRILTENN